MNAKLWSLGASTLVLGVFAWNASAATPQEKKPLTGEEARIQRGFQIAPVPLTIASRHLDSKLVGKGSYIVNAQADCNGCHGNPVFAEGHDPYQGQPKQYSAVGYLRGGQEFGPFTSRDIRPNAEGLPAGLNYAQFRQVLRTGHDPEGEHPQFGPLLQVMPWPAYQDMIDEDIRAIYEYLSALPLNGEDED
jgi:hypothetical protein